MKSKAVRPPLPITLDSDAASPRQGLKGFESPANPQTLTHGEISQRAYSIWECAGRPENCEMANWLEAEAEVLAEA